MKNLVYLFVVYSGLIISQSCPPAYADSAITCGTRTGAVDSRTGTCPRITPLPGGGSWALVGGVTGGKCYYCPRIFGIYVLNGNCTYQGDPAKAASGCSAKDITLSAALDPSCTNIGVRIEHLAAEIKPSGKHLDMDTTGKITVPANTTDIAFYRGREINDIRWATSRKGISGQFNLKNTNINRPLNVICK